MRAGRGSYQALPDGTQHESTSVGWLGESVPVRLQRSRPLSEAPLIAIPSDCQTVGDQTRYTADVIPVDAIVNHIGALPVIVPALGERLKLDALLSRVDGVFMPGGLTNVHPCCYGHLASEKRGPFDRLRDATALPLARAALQRGLPLLVTCRGFQELNVALGGTLRREPEELPEEERHGTPESAETEDERYRLRHVLHVRRGGVLHQLLGDSPVLVNSLHSDLIDKLASGLLIEATADDGSIEAASVAGAPTFALGVIFHPEYWAGKDRPSSVILEAFGAAVRAHASQRAVGSAAA
jgi:putative glutamine amidotransferase